jgi:hypothetical protein
VTPQEIPVQKVKHGKAPASKKGTTVTPLKDDVLSKVHRSTKKKATFGKEWETFLKERIREDKELNLRIIRYEV